MCVFNSVCQTCGEREAKFSILKGKLREAEMALGHFTAGLLPLPNFFTKYKSAKSKFHRVEKW